MKKLIGLMIFMALFGMTAIYGQNADAGAAPEEEKGLSFSVGADVGSTYYWRGYDVYFPALSAAGNPDNSFNFVPGLFPYVSVSTSNGFTLDIWGAAALGSRDLADGGLEDLDELDVTLSYEKETSAGTFAGSVAAYTFTALETYPEVSVSYTAPWELLNPSLLFAASFGAFEAQYTALSLSHELGTEELSFAPEFIYGYWISEEAQHLDLNLPIVKTISEAVEIHANVIGSYRIAGFEGSKMFYSTNLGSSYSF